MTVPTTTDRVVLAEAVRRVEGVLLTGGDDINSDLYDPKLPRKIKKTVEQTPDGGARDLRELILINSSHHQAVQVVAEPFTATAVSADGIVEAMELKPAAQKMPFLLSVQFHPERLTPRYAAHRAIFDSFVAACVRKSSKKS